MKTYVVLFFYWNWLKTAVDPPVGFWWAIWIIQKIECKLKSLKIRKDVSIFWIETFRKFIICTKWYKKSSTEINVAELGQRKETFSTMGLISLWIRIYIFTFVTKKSFEKNLVKSLNISLISYKVGHLYYLKFEDFNNWAQNVWSRIWIFIFQGSCLIFPHKLLK